MDGNASEMQRKHNHNSEDLAGVRFSNQLKENMPRN